MKKISFNMVWPVLLAIAVFLIVTIFMFKPVFFDNKIVTQPDIEQAQGSAKAVRDYREKTGEQALWVPSMFSGMPAYLISVEWGNKILGQVKKFASFGMSYVTSNIFLSLVCYYILLLAFGVRWQLAIGGAIAFALSSYMIIGVIAGHNARVGAIAFMPLVIAGIHLAFSGKKILGFGVTTAGLALHLRENHIQVTYYMVLIVAAYGLMQLIVAVREKKIADFGKTIGILLIGAVIAAGTYYGQFRALNEYSAYSTRGKSELVVSGQKEAPKSGLTRDQAFRFSYGILEPIVLFVPDFYGGSSMNFLVSDQNSNVYKALMRSGDPKTANQLANATSAYWGEQPVTSPYYAGAIIMFLFVVGIFFAEKKYMWWLIACALLGIMLTWGKSFAAFNYFIFDYLPGYNKFRSVTFGLVITLFAIPLLGMLGLEKLLTSGITPEAKKKLWIALGSTAGFCFLLLVISGMLPFMKDSEAQLPAWFTDALADDRKSLLRGDALRSLIFILLAFAAIFFDVSKKISAVAFYAFLTLIILIDVAAVDKRYLTKDSFQSKRNITTFNPTPADNVILQDKSYYRVYDLQWEEARTSNFHNSIGGYHGAKMRRYQDLADSCIFKQTNEMIQDLRAGTPDMKRYSVLNMLNVKYIVYGPAADNVIPNNAANGSAWFVRSVKKVASPTKELNAICATDSRDVAVVDESVFKVGEFGYDSAAVINNITHDPDHLVYESTSSAAGLAVFSEIYYPEGWSATIDGQPADIMRADYVLRALMVPAGTHKIEFVFKPAAYYTGNTITTASSWLALLVLLGSIGWSFRKEN